MNYWYNMQPYYDIENINTYPAVLDSDGAKRSWQDTILVGHTTIREVNPAREKGQQLMDAGRVYFEDGTGPAPEVEMAQIMGWVGASAGDVS